MRLPATSNLTAQDIAEVKRSKYAGQLDRDDIADGSAKKCKVRFRWIALKNLWSLMSAMSEGGVIVKASSFPG